MDETELPVEVTEGQNQCNYLKQSLESDASRSQRNVHESCEWFAMSATYGRSMKAKAILENNEIRCFVPMKYTMVNDRRQGKVRKLIPAINNLIFAYATKKTIQSVKQTYSFLQYLTRPEGGRRVPIVVPEKQMTQFMSVCETLDESLLYMAPDEVSLEEGTPVRIVGGEFDGIEATFVRVNKGRKKKVVVLVQGVAAVMLTELSEGYLQVI